MKKLILTLTLCSVFTLSAWAQEAPQTDPIAKTSETITRLMVESVGLNENEYIQLKALNMKRLSEAAEAVKTYSNDEAAQAARLRDIEEEFEEKLFVLFNSRQVAAYSEFKNKPQASLLTLVQEVAPKGKRD